MSNKKEFNPVYPLFYLADKIQNRLTQIWEYEQFLRHREYKESLYGWRGFPLDTRTPIVKTSKLQESGLQESGSIDKDTLSYFRFRSQVPGFEVEHFYDPKSSLFEDLLFTEIESAFIEWLLGEAEDSFPYVLKMYFVGERMVNPPRINIASLRPANIIECSRPNGDYNIVVYLEVSCLSENN